MKRLLALILIVATFAVAPARADDAGLRAALQARYDAMKIAMAAHDRAATGALLATGFTSIDVGGKSETAAQMLDEVAALKTDPNKTSVTTLVSIAQSGTTATVEQKYDMKTVKHAADGSARNIELITLSTDTWTNASGSWLMQRTATKSVDIYLNGTLVDHQDASAP